MKEMKVKRKNFVTAPPVETDNEPSKFEKKLKNKKLKPKSKAIAIQNGKPEVTKKKPTKKDGKKGKKKSETKSHKESLEKLKEIDPEFYRYLEDNDRKLLKFNVDEEDDGREDDEAKHEESGDDDDEDLHKPTQSFEAASDESDFEDAEKDEDESDGGEFDPTKTRTITLKLLKTWQQELAEDKVSVNTIKNVVMAVNSALLSISGEQMNIRIPFKVEGAAVFNGVMQLCVLHLYPAVKRFLGLMGRTSKKPHKCKKWNKLRASLRDYLIDITKLLEHISSTNILIVLLKHLHQISNLIASFANLTKPILKRLVVLWSTSEETARVLSFLCILKITRSQPTTLLNNVLKAMYLSYVRNSKFVSPNTLPGINFMRRSLTEMFALDLNVSYTHVFLYIRQLAIHLRNAVTLKKKDSFQSVYNWQYINSLRLWAELLSATCNKAQLQPLIYPLVSIITGVIKLIPTAQYFPLRFHCIAMLNHISKETRCFIPVLPFILEVLNSNTFNAKHSKVSMKPLKFTCILRLNKAQLQENGFRDEVIESVFGMILDYMAHESFTISYPDLMVPCFINLKQYMKRCRNRNYNSKIRQLCDKLQENAKMIESEKEKINFTLKDAAAINAWELSLQAKGTPLLAFYNNWIKTDIRSRKRHAINSDDINEYNLPSIKRKPIDDDAERKRKTMHDGPVELFPSDDEDEQPLEVEKTAAAINEKKSKKSKREKMVKQAEEKLAEEEASDEDDFLDDGIDIVKDLDLDDW